MDAIELDADGHNIIIVDKATKAIIVHKPLSPSSEPPKVYQFDNVFGPDSSQVNFLTRLSTPIYPFAQI